MVSIANNIRYDDSYRQPHAYAEKSYLKSTGILWYILWQKRMYDDILTYAKVRLKLFI